MAFPKSPKRSPMLQGPAFSRFRRLRDLLPFTLCPNPIQTRNPFFAYSRTLLFSPCPRCSHAHAPLPLSPSLSQDQDSQRGNDSKRSAVPSTHDENSTPSQRSAARPALRKHRKHSEQEKQQQGDDPTISPTQPIIRRPMAFSCTGIVIKRDTSKGLAETGRPKVFCCVIPAAALYLLNRAFPSCLQVTLRLCARCMDGFGGRCCCNSFVLSCILFLFPHAPSTAFAGPPALRQRTANQRPYHGASSHFIDRLIRHGVSSTSPLPLEHQSNNTTHPSLFPFASYLFPNHVRAPPRCSRPSEKKNTENS